MQRVSVCCTECVAQSTQNIINGSCVTRLIHMCGTTQSNVCHDFTCVTCLLSLAVGTWQFSKVSLLQSSLLQNDGACYRMSKLATECTIKNHYRAIFRECLLVLSKALYQEPLYQISPHMSTCTIQNLYRVSFEECLVTWENIWLL